MSKIQLPLFKDYTQLPTKKNHISFSEIFIFEECSFRHKLLHVNKLGQELPNQFLIFGTTMHNGMEQFLLNHHYTTYNHQETINNSIKELDNKFNEINFIDENKEWETSLIRILTDWTKWLQEGFPSYKLYGAEIQLFEPIEGHINTFFKGFIDLVLKVPKQPKKGSKIDLNKPIEYVYHIIDFKSCSFGWTFDQKTDPMKKMQLILYKYFFCKKFNINPKDVKCSFLLCKRIPNKKSGCFELLDVSVGDITTKRSLEIIDKMLVSLKKGLYKKNKKSCKYCQFTNTKECP